MKRLLLVALSTTLALAATYSWTFDPAFAVVAVAVFGSWTIGSVLWRRERQWSRREVRGG